MWTKEDLLDSLRGLGLLRSPELERAYRAVDQEAFLPDGLGPLAYADMPLPVLDSLTGPTMPSARCLVAALELLEVMPDHKVLLGGGRGGYPAALLATVAGERNLVVVEPDPERRAVTARRLASSGRGDLRVLASPPEGETFDRVLLLDPSVPRPRELASCLADLGFLIGRGRGVDDLTFTKIVRSGKETMHMTIGQAPVPAHAGPRPSRAMSPVDFARLFAVEDLLIHAWEGRILGHYDQHFQDVADETFAGGPLDLESFDPAREPPKLAARRAFQAAYILQSAGELERAADAYDRSIRLAPTAEAHTFLGWTASFMGRYERAIEECRLAIQVDPTFGNPYNDIGAYLIELGRLDEAISWLEKALAAPRYCCYFYAHANLARVYVQKGLREKARKHLKAALEVNPEYEPARELLRRLDTEGGYYA
jgi:protein-L-isoaspartate O-methyltransferase